MIPEVAKQNLADYIDVFCDRFFTDYETEKILEWHKTWAQTKNTRK